MEEIKIKYHTNIEPIVQTDKGDWIDMRVAEDVTIRPGEFKLVSMGVSMKIPDGYEMHLAPRSSTFKNFGIIQVNSVGVIDESYCGNDDIIKMPVYCLIGRENDGEFTTIHKNDRICQFRIIPKQPKINFVKVDNMEDASRGGFGSTGVN